MQNLWHYTLTTVPSEGVSLALLGASSSLDGAEAVTRKGRGSSEGGYRNSLRIKFTKDRERTKLIEGAFKDRCVSSIEVDPYDHKVFFASLAIETFIST